MIKFPGKRPSKKKKQQSKNAETTSTGRTSVLAGFRPETNKLKATNFQDENKEGVLQVLKGDQHQAPPENLVEEAVAKVNPNDRENRFQSTSNCGNSLSNEEGAVGCQLFHDDEEENIPTTRPQSVELPKHLLSMPPGPSISRPHILKKLDDGYKLPISHNPRPPTEINIDLDAIAPPSPIRDPSVAFQGTMPEDGALDQYANDGPNAQLHFDVEADSGIQTRLCDAERLVRVILGSNSEDNLGKGAILEAIRTFAVMKQELVQLRRMREVSDGDPPAILTNLTSPATTKNTSSLSTPAKTSTPSGGPPREILVSCSSPDESQQSLSLRNALVLAARKCQSLEKQLSGANKVIDDMRVERNSKESDQKLREELERLKAENQLLKKAQSTANIENLGQYGVSKGKLEGHNSKLRDMPSSSNLKGDRRRMNHTLQDIARDPDAILDPTDPLESARRQIQQKNDHIAQLTASQIRLQSLLQMAVAKANPLQEVALSNHKSSERIRILEEEHRALTESLLATGDVQL